MQLSTISFMQKQFMVQMFSFLLLSLQSDDVSTFCPNSLEHQG
jgi:hypothetical protein